jgi:signal transduction histidine kinase
LANSSSSLTTLIIIIASLVAFIGGGVLTFFILRRGDSGRRASIQRTSNIFGEAEKPKRIESHRLWEIYRLISTLTATLSYQRVLENAIDLSFRALGTKEKPAEQLIGAVLLFSESDSIKPNLYVGEARGFTRTDMGDTFPALSGLLKETIDEGAPMLSKSVQEDAELNRIIALQMCKSAYCIPLRAGIDTYGVLLFAHPNPEYFTATYRAVLDTIGNQAMIAIQNARLYRDLEQEKERMMDIQDEARKKLARDLHDGPTQSVAAIAMRVNFARRLLERDAKAASDELFKIEDLARRTTKEIRHMLFTLRPLVLESQGLTAALESMAEKMRETYNQNVTIDVDPAVIPVLEMGKQGVIFYIAEEAVTNARKHARADHIWVRLKQIENEIALLEIQDDGIGFDVGTVDATYEHRGSLGMLNMRERAELVNGIINVKSTKGGGTRIQVVIPLTEEAIDRIHRNR